MLPCLDKFVVEHDLYLLVKEFAAAMRKECAIRTLPAGHLGRKTLELIWQLHIVRKPNKTHMQNLHSGSMRRDCIDCMRVCTFDTWTHSKE